MDGVNFILVAGTILITGGSSINKIIDARIESLTSKTLREKRPITVRASIWTLSALKT